MGKTEWICCPVCGNKTRDRVREDTILKIFPLYCPKCKQESLIEAKSLQITVIKEPNDKGLDL
ncbi:cysteine-rich KTR domain-containing protein [Enterococcus mediterraneensis]|uniref:cysteine-rich KTR domain-containing protein n=1 Tax=Enterococcus mediterraneensis TaxID=2364791 RepID=UPI000F046F9F|nr:cysteine-rich KTR domain-containing protein [Enterococcus mediterraneensis]